MSRLQELRLLDDAAFARTLAAHKWRTQRWGAPRIAAALAQRCVPPAAARAALDDLFAEDGDAGGDDAQELLLQSARRRWHLSRGLGFEARPACFAESTRLACVSHPGAPRRRGSGAWWAGSRGAGTAGAWRATSSPSCRRSRTPEPALQGLPLSRAVL